ncbi:hypothetical protein J4421_03285 [Candidatus Woesearchaeota archaeon]|nr:hypothetical protein [Candidatus Woesearchaeota archaeon]
MGNKNFYPVSGIDLEGKINYRTINSLLREGDANFRLGPQSPSGEGYNRPALYVRSSRLPLVAESDPYDLSIADDEGMFDRRS